MISQECQGPELQYPVKNFGLFATRIGYTAQRSGIVFIDSSFKAYIYVLNKYSAHKI
jgi:hypothetical protein